MLRGDAYMTKLIVIRKLSQFCNWILPLLVTLFILSDISYASGYFLKHFKFSIIFVI